MRRGAPGAVLPEPGEAQTSPPVCEVKFMASDACGNSEWPGRRSIPRLYVLAIIVAAMLLRLPFMRGDLTDHDTWRQTDTATIARNFVADGNILWPRVNWAAPGPGYVEAEFQLVPYAASLVYRLFGENALFGRLLSLVMTCLTCLTFHRLAHRFFDPWAALVALTFFAMSPLLFRYSRDFIPDPTMLCFYLVALERFLAYLDDRGWTSLIASAAAMGLAILVKPTSIHLGLVLAIVAVARMGWGGLLRPQLLVFAAISLLPPFAYYLHAAEIHFAYGNTFGVISGGDSKFGKLSDCLDPLLVPRLLRIDIQWAAGPVGWLLALAGLIAYRSEGWRLLGCSWVGTLLIYYLIVARYAGNEQLGLHYHLFAAAPIALLAGGGLVALVERCRRIRFAGLVVVMALVLGYEGLAAGLIVTKKPHRLFREAGAKLAELSSQDDIVLVLSEDVAGRPEAPNNFEQPDVFFHARRRGRLLPRDRQTHEGLEQGLSYGPRWYVNFDRFNDRAEPTFLPEIRRRMREVFVGDGFEIFAVIRSR